MFWHFKKILESIELICLFLDRFRLVLFFLKNLVDVRFSSILNLVMMSMIIVMLILAHSKIKKFSSPYDPYVHLTGSLLSLLLGMVKQGTGGWAVREEEIPGNLMNF